MADLEDKYRSRKFIVTILGLVLGTFLALVDKLTPGMANVIAAAMASYNIANAWAGRQ